MYSDHYYHRDYYRRRNSCNDLLFYAVMSGRCCRHSAPTYVPYPVFTPFFATGYPYRLM